MEKKVLMAMMAAAAIPVMAQTAPSDTVKAQYPGGEAALKEYIEANRVYPAAAKRNGIEGIVDVRFIVKTDGAREQISIVRLVDPDLEAEAIRLVKDMPAWTPATIGGKPVDSESTVKVEFLM